MPRHVMKGEWVRTTQQLRNKPAVLATEDGDPVPVSLPAGTRVRVERGEVQGCVRVEVTTPSGAPALLMLEDGEWEECWEEVDDERPLAG